MHKSAATLEWYVCRLR